MRKFSLFQKTTAGARQLGTRRELEVQGHVLLWVGGGVL